MADSRWWCGRIMAVTDRLRLEMLRAPQTERDNKAFKELFDLCPDQDTIEILKVRISQAFLSMFPDDVCGI